MMTKCISRMIENKYDEISKAYPPYKEDIYVLSYGMIRYVVTF